MAAAVNKLNTNPNSQLKSTQNSLLIAEIKDGILILKDGTMRAVILSSAINFDLMSRQEQDAVEYSYQGFLNSLHFPIQIVVRSQKIDLENYLNGLAEMRASQDNELLGLLTEDYIANIKGLLEEVNIMKKQFYVVVPYEPAVISKTGFFNSLKSIFANVPVTSVSESDFNQFKNELTQRVALVASGLTQMGIRAIPLNSQELIDLYYSTYNPDVAINQRLIDANALQTPVVQRTERPIDTGQKQVSAMASDETVAPASSAMEDLPAVNVAQVATQAPAEPAPMVAPLPVTPPAPVAPPAPEPTPVAQAPVATAPNPLATPPQVSTDPAVNPTAFDPYALNATQGSTNAPSDPNPPQNSNPGGQ